MGADRVVSGPQGTNSFDQQAILLDATNGLLGVSGNSRQVAWLRAAVLSLGPQAALANITTAQTLMSKAFGAGALNLVGRTLKVRGTLIYTTTGNAATLTFVLMIGATALCTITTPATAGSAAANLPVQFEFDVYVASLGVNATIESHGIVRANIGTVPAAITTNYLDTNIAVSGAVNLLQAQTISVTLAASAAVPSAQLRNAAIEVVS